MGLAQFSLWMLSDSMPVSDLLLSSDPRGNLGRLKAQHKACWQEEGFLSQDFSPRAASLADGNQEMANQGLQRTSELLQKSARRVEIVESQGGWDWK